MISSAIHEGAMSLRELQRRLKATLPEAPHVEDARPLELTQTPDGVRPHVAAAAPTEDPAMRCRDIEGDVEPGFAAFLDGSQMSYVHHYADGIPVVVGWSGAVIRRRRERRMNTWRHTSAVALYVPLRALPSGARDRIATIGVDVRDTSDESFSGNDADVVHPFVMTDAAVHAVQRDREKLERELAFAWCASEGDPLLVDGGIAGNPLIAASPLVVGAVKSHHIIYGGPEAYRTIGSLRERQRSSAVVIDSGHAKRSPVASWYLRLRQDRAKGPFWGLVRVEVAFSAAGRAGEITPRADEVSRWILAEGSPLSLPDSRWDKMVYGVRDCEEFLRAIRT